MKGLKKVLTGILAGAMALSLTLSAGSAIKAEAATIVINRDNSSKKPNVDEAVVKAQKYTYYKILSADIITQDAKTTEGPTNGSATYYVTDADQKTELEKAGLSFSEMIDGTTTKYILTNANTFTNGDELAKKLNEKIDLTKFTKQEIAAGETSTTIDGLTDGYYLIVSAVGSKLMAQTLGNQTVTLTEKNVYPTVDKKQSKTKLNYADDKLKVKVGDIIYYDIEVEIPKYSGADIFVTDTMSKGLKFNDDVSIVDADGFEPEVVAKTTADTFTFKYKFSVDKIKTLADTKKVYFYFSATVTEDALKDTGRINDVDLDYYNYHETDNVPYTIEKTGLEKKDFADNQKKMKGVEFKLVEATKDADGKDVNVEVKVTKNDEGVYYPDDNGSSTVVTDDNSKIIIRGLEPGKNYKVIETKALPGYNFPAEESARTWTLTLEEDAFSTDANGNNTVTDPTFLTVNNNQGVTLPSTGGIGTTIFYLIGGLLIVAAVVYFVVRRKADAE
jgi:LPXTG-motif cell wall-anchored protein